MAYDLNGTTQYLYRTDLCGLSSYPFTMACWYHPDTNTTNACPMAFSDSTTTAHFNLLQFDYDLLGTVRQTSNTGSSAHAVSATTYTTGNWHHIAAVCTNSNDRTVFLNGVNEATNTTTKSFPSGTMNRFSIGALIRSSVINYCDGRLCEAALWDRALSDDEVASLATGMSPLYFNSIHAYWPLVRDAKDIVGGYDLTIQGSPPIGDHYPGLICDYGGQTMVPSSEGGAPAVPSYTTQGSVFLYTSANWAGKYVYYEASLRATLGTAYSRLYNLTDGEVVADSEISTTVTSGIDRVRSSALTLVNGKEYVAQFGRIAGDTGVFTGSRLIFV